LINELLIQEIEDRFPGQSFLTLEEVAQFMRCGPEVIYNWTKRPNPKRRPPRIPVGKELRFPKRPFAQWLADELGA
jgi:predicted DNA-binding transcriptional regulator AlpA